MGIIAIIGLGTAVVVVAVVLATSIVRINKDDDIIEPTLGDTDKVEIRDEPRIK